MELKLIKSEPLSQKLIDEFYSHLEQKESETVVTRRNFLKYSALGAIALGFSFSTERAEAGGNNNYVKGFKSKGFKSNCRFNNVIPQSVYVNQQYLNSGEATSGDITVTNNTDQYMSDELELTLISSRDLRYSTTKYYSYNIPPFTRKTYSFNNGPSASTSRTTKVCLCASNQHARSNSRNFTLYA